MTLFGQTLEQTRFEHIIIGVEAVVAIGFMRCEGAIPDFPDSKRWGGHSTQTRNCPNLVGWGMPSFGLVHGVCVDIE